MFKVVVIVYKLRKFWVHTILQTRYIVLYVSMYTVIIKKINSPVQLHSVKLIFTKFSRNSLNTHQRCFQYMISRAFSYSTENFSLEIINLSLLFRPIKVLCISCRITKTKRFRNSQYFLIYNNEYKQTCKLRVRWL